MQKRIYRYGRDESIEFWAEEGRQASRDKAKVFVNNAGAAQAINRIKKLYPNVKAFFETVK